MSTTTTTATEGLLIGGQRTDAAEGGTFDVVNPATGERLATVAEAGAEDVNRAVAAAAAAYEQWGALSPVTRGRTMHRFANLVEEHAEELAMIECRNVGMPISDARGQLGMIIDVIRYYAGAVDKFFGNTIPVERNGVAMTFREPIGVVGLITPWNFPLNIANWKAAPALAAGNTVVLKPASLTPLSVLRYAELAVEAGIPPGALNVVPGPGSVVGDALVTHPDVGKIGFTGSTEVGAGIARSATASIKRVTLELGGKSACVVFEDANIEKVGRLAPFGVFENCGQDCCARSRLIVQRSVKDELVERYAATTAAIRVGMPEDPETQVGPMISSGQRDTVEGYIRQGVADGASVVTGGERPGGDLQQGFFLRPAVLDGVRNDMTVARDEIFGPVVGVIPFDTEEDAIRIANDTPYGLAGSLWTRDGARQLRVARAIRTGVLGVNTNSSVFVQTPFGGYKQSGVGKELGMHALEHNTELKSVFISTE
jgi:betaine-aldehyde dehydrogenase